MGKKGKKTAKRPGDFRLIETKNIYEFYNHLKANYFPMIDSNVRRVVSEEYRLALLKSPLFVELLDGPLRDMLETATEAYLPGVNVQWDHQVDKKGAWEGYLVNADVVDGSKSVFYRDYSNVCSTMDLWGRINGVDTLIMSIIHLIDSSEDVVYFRDTGKTYIIPPKNKKVVDPENIRTLQPKESLEARVSEIKDFKDLRILKRFEFNNKIHDKHEESYDLHKTLQKKLVKMQNKHEGQGGKWDSYRGSFTRQVASVLWKYDVGIFNLELKDGDKYLDPKVWRPLQIMLESTGCIMTDIRGKPLKADGKYTSFIVANSKKSFNLFMNELYQDIPYKNK